MGRTLPASQPWLGCQTVWQAATAQGREGSVLSYLCQYYTQGAAALPTLGRDQGMQKKSITISYPVSKLFQCAAERVSVSGVMDFSGHLRCPSFLYPLDAAGRGSNRHPSTPSSLYLGFPKPPLDPVFKIIHPPVNCYSTNVLSAYYRDSKMLDTIGNK